MLAAAPLDEGAAVYLLYWGLPNTWLHSLFFKSKRLCKRKGYPVAAVGLYIAAAASLQAGRGDGACDVRCFLV